MFLTRISLSSAAVVALINCSDIPDFDDPRAFEASDGESSCSNLLVNGDFDDGPEAWTSTPDETIQNENNFPHIDLLYAHSGSYFIWLGGEYGITRTIEQTIFVPGYGSGLTLEGKTFVSSDAAGNPVEDTLKVEVVDAITGSVLSTPLSWSNQNTIGGDNWSWQDFSANVSGDFAWQEVVLRWTSVSTQTDNTNFLFDSLTLKPSSCR